MVEFEADAAIAAAAVRFGADERVERILVCTPDKDMAQLVQGDRIVLWDRRRNLTYDDAGVRAKWGVPPTSIPDYLGLVGDSSDGFPGLPGWGSKSAAAVLTRYGHFEDIPPKASAWEVPGLGGSRAMSLAATLRDHWADAILYRDLARLRTADDGVVIRQRDAEELRWDGAPRAEWEAFCEEWGLPRLAARPHRWQADA
jgi:5'-3' exonuclease